MTLRRNQSVPRFSASVLTTVGLMRVSIGPPARISVSGTAGSPSASISAVAASTGTDGWHTANTCTSPPKKRNMSRHGVDVVVEIEAAGRSSGTSRASCQSVM